MDRLYLDLVPDGEESVHYTLMPSYDESAIDNDLEERMELAQRASSMVLALRRKVNIKVRQPLSKIVIPVISDKVRAQLELVKSLILGEVNVKEAEFMSDTAVIITKKIKPNFKTLGKVYGKRMKEIASAFGEISQQEINAIQNAETAGAAYTLNLEGGEVVLNPGDYMISSEDMPGWLVASEGSMTLALDIEITEELRNEGIARELVNRIQNVRKDSGFEVTDKVDVTVYAGDGEINDINGALAAYRDYVAGQTLALSIETRPMEEAGENAVEAEWNETTIRIAASRR